MIDRMIRPARDPDWLQWVSGAVAGLMFLLLISIFWGPA